MFTPILIGTIIGLAIVFVPRFLASKIKNGKYSAPPAKRSPIFDEDVLFFDDPLSIDIRNLSHPDNSNHAYPVVTDIY